MALPPEPNLLIEANFEKKADVLRFPLDGLAELPEPVRPTHFGMEERPRRRPANEIANTERFHRFVRSARGGFYLYGAGCTFEISPDHVRPEEPPWSEIVFLAHLKGFRPALGKAIMEIFFRFGAVYGFGADWDEYDERNGYTLQFIDKGSVHGFLGRDFRRYVPGLYWLNYFSDDYRNDKGMEVGDIAEELGGTVLTTPGGTILQLYNGPADWRERNDAVCRIIDETPNVFSKRDVEFPTGVTRMEYIHGDASNFEDPWPW